MPRNKKYWKRRFGEINDKTMPVYQQHLDLRAINDLDDEGFAYLISNVKGVNMLDLNETEITNYSIGLLSRLDYVNELRVKGCGHLDDACIEDMNKINGLQFLHFKDTRVTIDGLLKLNAVPDLKELMFSAGMEENIEEKMLELRKILPACDFTVNAKPYNFMKDPE